MSPLPLFLLLLLTTLPSTHPHPADLHSLLALTTTLHLPHPILSTWNASSGTPCRWAGVRCDARGHVSGLILPNLSISGRLGPALGELRWLRKLDLGMNGIEGGIPVEVGRLERLREVDLSGNRLDGEIPGVVGGGRLEVLSLFDNRLTGAIPETLFARGSNLTTVYLNQNRLTGSIPHSVGEMRRITSLWLNDNFLTGEVPNSIQNCTELEELYLSNNNLSGSLTLRALESLVYLDVSRNNFVGKIPVETANCMKLRQLVLSYNNFDGEIPFELGSCGALVDFAAVGNRLSGEIPASIGHLTNLSSLFLNENRLSGSIPREIGKCRSLSWLQLQANQISGAIPRELGMLSNLQILSVFSNSLNGEIPTEVWRIPSLEVILLYNNNFSGTLPLEITELMNLKNVSLFNNNFHGAIPETFGINSSLVEVDFTNNSFSGGIPRRICTGNRLSVLNLGRNSFQGSIPSVIGECLSLRRLILSYNNLSGPLPDFVENSGLLYMDLSRNNLSGAVPRSLGNCVNITSVNWSQNKLKGTIPREIRKLVNLQLLNFSRNYLFGNLPPQLSKCSQLYLLDLSYNSLNGSLPSSLSDLRLLSHLVLEGNRFSGKIPHYLADFKKLLELRLGENCFAGRIPSRLGELQNLAVALNLSRNALSGKIPLELGNLKKLQILDLSLNKFTGSLMPLGGLYSLLYLNVSYNNFIGSVPFELVKFVYSSPSSFWDNPSLCLPCQSSSKTHTRNSNLECCGESSTRRGFSKFQIAMIVVACLLFCILVFLVLSYCCLRSKKTTENSEKSVREGSSFLLNKVMEATENLSSKYIIGQGAHGTVYKAFLSQEKVYAVKKLNFGLSKGSNLSMVTEIRTLGKIRHRNLVKLVYFWMRGDHGLILYDYMPNGSLHDVLHELKPPPVLEWDVRYKIALGTAHGLAYLHYDCNPSIIHRDIKPKNIMLDMDMEPHISDFGIAKLIDQSSVSPLSSAVIGTIGYISPESAYSTRKSKESDVYSYGVVVLELLSRKYVLDSLFPETTDLVTQANSPNPDALEGIVDPDLINVTVGSNELEEIKAVLKLALRCTAKNASERPTMRDVVKQLNCVKSKISSSIGKFASEGVSKN